MASRDIMDSHTARKLLPHSNMRFVTLGEGIFIAHQNNEGHIKRLARLRQVAQEMFSHQSAVALELTHHNFPIVDIAALFGSSQCGDKFHDLLLGLPRFRKWRRNSWRHRCS
jgi:hypothetical protein